MEIILEIVLELIVQIVFELLADAGLRTVESKKGNRGSSGSFAAICGYLILGAIVGGLSLLVFRESFISTPWLKWLNLLISPIVAGGLMAYIGRVRAKGEKKVLRIEKFWYGWLFAFALALVRLIWAG